MFKMLLAVATIIASAPGAYATIISGSAAQQGVAGPAGLSGSYYKAGAGATNFAISNTLADETGANLAGTFRATSLNYSGSDASSITSFLGSDAGSYKGRVAASYDMSDGILDMSGYLYVASAGTYTFALTHDDSAQLTIGGQTLISANCCGTDSAQVTFSSAGYYATDVVYSNTYYGGGTGGATFSLTENGNVLTSANLFTSVPEPASLALLGVALAGTAIIARRRRTAPTMS